MLGVFTLIAIFTSPLIALWISNKIEEKKRRRSDKIMIFKELMTFKKNNDDQSQSALAENMNLIDIVFFDVETVLNAYHVLRDSLRSPVRPSSQIGDLFVELLRSIALDLDYKIDDKNLEACLGWHDLKRHAEPFQNHQH
jgi:ABC-type dipeptide/oligopeptide/nickel transport system ATPase subunit